MERPLPFRLPLVVVAFLLVLSACSADTSDAAGERAPVGAGAIVVPTLPAIADIEAPVATPTPEPTPEGPVPLRVVTMMGLSLIHI